MEIALPTISPTSSEVTQKRFEFDDDIAAAEPRWVEVNAVGVRVENLRQFGGPWLALHLIRTLQLDTFLDRVIPERREHVPWDVTSLILIIARLLEPSSELYVAEQWYAQLTSCSRLASARKSEPVAFPSPLTTNRSCWKKTASNCLQK